MNNFSREIISDIHRLVSKAKAFENQLEPLANLYNEVNTMKLQLEDLEIKILDIETNINKGGIEADDLRHILRDAFSRITERELLSFNLDSGSIQDAFENNAEGDVELCDEEFDIQSGNQIVLEDYRFNYRHVRWESVAEDIQFDADFDDEALTDLIDRIVDKVCPPSFIDVSDDVLADSFDSQKEDGLCS